MTQSSEQYFVCVCVRVFVKSNSHANMSKLSYSRKTLQMHEDMHHDFSVKLVIEPILNMVNLQPVLGNYALLPLYLHEKENMKWYTYLLE